MAGHPDRKLRLTHRDRERLVAPDSRRRAYAAVLYRGYFVRSRRALALIGQTREPLLVPTDDERTGYVPNVVYSCGAMVHNGNLIVPYAMSDLSTSVAKIDSSAAGRVARDLDAMRSAAHRHFDTAPWLAALVQKTTVVRVPKCSSESIQPGESISDLRRFAERVNSRTP